MCKYSWIRVFFKEYKYVIFDKYINAMSYIILINRIKKYFYRKKQ